MKSRVIVLCVLLGVSSAPASADDERIEAAVGGGIGGAVGAVVGQEIGGREGAIIGGAAGAAIGVAVATEGNEADGPTPSVPVRIEVESKSHPQGRHCPPGQAKKGRC